MGAVKKLRPIEKIIPLWHWRATAFDLCHSERYLNRIKAVAVDLLKGKSLSNRARAAMEKDLNRRGKALSVSSECSQ